MNIEQCKMFLKNVENGSVQAFIGGKQVEVLNVFSEWSITTNPSFSTDEHRIQEKKYRPFTPQEAVDYLGQKVIYGPTAQTYIITGVCSEGIYLKSIDRWEHDGTYEDLLNNYTFEDGSRCGIEE